MSKIGRAYRAGVHTTGRPRHLHMRVFSSGARVPGSDASVPGPPGSGAGAGSPARTRALVALHLEMTNPQHTRWFGYAERGAGNPDVERFTQDTDVDDWYGKAADDKSVTYATYFDTQASTVEPAEEFAGTITIAPPPPAPPPTKPVGSNLGFGLGIGLAVVGLVAAAKSR